MIEFENYQAAVEPDTWTRQADTPLVLTVDGETAVPLADVDKPVPYALTPKGEANADTWTRRVSYQLTPKGEAAAGKWAAYLAQSAGTVAREPEAGS